MRTLNKEELYDILNGCVILGCGGGGSLERSVKQINEALDKGYTFKLASFDDIDDDDYIVTAYYCGAISPDNEVENKKYANLPLLDRNPVLAAVNQLENTFKIKINGIISSELGGGNTGVALYIAATSGKYLVDGDPAGRALPELQQSTYFLDQIPMTPISLVNKFGESAIFTKVASDFRAETLVRALAVVSKNRIGVADHLMKASILKNSVIKGAISQALVIGQTWRKSLECKTNVASDVAAAGGGVVFFNGKLETVKWDTIDGFTVGDLYIKNSEGDMLRIWFKNENLLSWLNNKPYIMSPDLICLFDNVTGVPLVNPNYTEGISVSAVVLPAPAKWTTPKGLATLGPEDFGQSIKWHSYKEILAK